MGSWNSRILRYKIYIICWLGRSRKQQKFVRAWGWIPILACSIRTMKYPNHENPSTQYLAPTSAFHGVRDDNFFCGFAPNEILKTFIEFMVLGFKGLIYCLCFACFFWFLDLVSLCLHYLSRFQDANCIGNSWKKQTMLAGNLESLKLWYTPWN